MFCSGLFLGKFWLLQVSVAPRRSFKPVYWMLFHHDRMYTILAFIHTMLVPCKAGTNGSSAFQHEFTSFKAAFTVYCPAVIQHPHVFACRWIYQHDGYLSNHPFCCQSSHTVRELMIYNENSSAGWEFQTSSPVWQIQGSWEGWELFNLGIYDLAGTSARRRWLVYRSSTDLGAEGNKILVAQETLT